MLFGLGAVLGSSPSSRTASAVSAVPLIAYVLFIITAIIGARITEPWFKRVAETAASSPDEAPSPELRAALDDPRARFTDWFDPIIILVFIFDMIVKPFG